MSWPITRDLKSTVGELFPVRRDRRVVLGLVVLAAVVSMTELAATRLFASLILPETDRTTTYTAVLVVLFLAFFASLRLVNYAREMYRLNVFERALKESVGLSPASDSWRWAMAMEVTQILSTLGRLVVITGATLILAWQFGVAVVLVAGLVGMSISLLYRRQFRIQREFRAMQLAYNPVDNATKVRTRIKAGETGSLVGYLGIVILIGLLLVMTLGGLIDPATGFVLFIALRMLGQTFTEFAKGLMRYVRARAFSEMPVPDEDDD